jgi:hypothetical protein
MRKQDIKLGTIYAYQNRSWNDPQPLVFLSSTLYRQRWRGDLHSDPAYLPGGDAGYTKPAAGRPTYSPAVGYPVLIGRQNALPDQIATMMRIKPIAITTGLAQQHADAGIYLTLLTRMASVIGLYDEVMQQMARQKDNDRRQREEATAARNRLQLQRDDLSARLEVLGIEVLRDYHHDDRMSFKLDELALIIARLEKLSQLERTTSLTTVARLLK